MSNFSGLALSRMEMKKVTGGCTIQTVGGGQSPGGYTFAEAQASAQMWGTHFCCDSCETATWYHK